PDQHQRAELHLTGGARLPGRQPRLHRYRYFKPLVARSLRHSSRSIATGGVYPLAAAIPRAGTPASSGERPVLCPENFLRLFEQGRNLGVGSLLEIAVMGADGVEGIRRLEADDLVGGSAKRLET